MARDCLLIRATNKSAAEVQLANSLSSYFGRHIYYLIDRYSDENTNIIFTEDKQIHIGKQFLDLNSLPYFPRVGWQCGDICLYAAAVTIPYYDYYWVVEPDVNITVKNKKDLMHRIGNKNSDLIGSNFGKRGPKWWWHKTMANTSNNNVYGSCFPFSRFSYDAILYLLNRRKDYFRDHLSNSDTSKNTRLIANDESFVATTLYNGGYSCASLVEAHPELMTHFSANTPIHKDELPFLLDKIVHPVCTDQNFLHKYAKLEKSNPTLAAERKNEFISNLGPEAWARATSTSKPYAHS